MKRVLSFFLAIMISALIIPFNLRETLFVEIEQRYAGSSSQEDFEIRNGTLTRYNGNGEYVVIPNSVIKIGDSAFNSCESLRSVEIPSSVTSIGNHAFVCCTNLKSVVIPSSVTSIGYDVFGDCTNLESVTIPSTITYIPDNTFCNCVNLKSTTIPSSVTNIGYNAFVNCTSLSSLDIPSSVRSIGNCAFANCSNLESINVEKGNKNYYSEGNCLIETATKALLVGCNSSIIPNDVTGIGPYAFSNRTSIKSIQIPSKVISIDECAFNGCKSLESVEIPSSVTSIGLYAFRECVSLENVVIPSSVTSIGDYVFYKCTNLKNVEFSSAMTCIPAFTFCDCTSLESVENLSSITIINNNAFKNCSNLTSIELPLSVNIIDPNAFYGCTSLTSVEIPSSVNIIGGYAFYGCTSIESVEIPSSVNIIGDYAFYGCTSLENIEIPSSGINIGVNAFNNCPAATYEDGFVIIGGILLDYTGYEKNVVIPNSVIKICDSVFEGRISIENVIVQSGVTEIGNSAFKNCSNLKSIEIPASVTSIGDNAFMDCTNLMSVEIPSGVTNIGISMFENCASLESVIIPSSVTNIGDSAFASCASLENVIIPSGVINIGDSAFANCASLTGVEIPTTVTSIGNYAFMDCINLTSVKILSSATNIGYGAFAGCANITSWKSINDKQHQRINENYGNIETENHEWDAGEVITAAKCEVNGTVKYTCEKCGATKTETIAKFGHIFSNGKCTVCGIKYCDIYNHNFVRGVCQNCGDKYVGDNVIDRYYGDYVSVRIKGDDRYKTSIQIANTLKGVLRLNKFDTIIVASGENFADALAGSYLAALTSAPMLVVNSGSQSEIKNYINNNLSSNGKVYILGGKAAVSDDFASSLKKGSRQIIRLAGESRTITNMEILKECLKYEPYCSTIVVCDSSNYADALSASSLGIPIILADKYNGLTSDQKSYIKNSNIKKVIIVGGENSVPTKIENVIKNMSGKTVTRLAGQNRFETSYLVANKMYSSVSNAVIAFGNNFPDGLCGGPLAFALGAPLILVDSDSSHLSFAKKSFDKSSIGRFTILGGNNSVDSTTEKTIGGWATSNNKKAKDKLVKEENKKYQDNLEDIEINTEVYIETQQDLIDSLKRQYGVSYLYSSSYYRNQVSSLDSQINDKQVRMQYLQMDTAGGNRVEVMRLQEEIDDLRNQRTEYTSLAMVAEMQEDLDSYKRSSRNNTSAEKNRHDKALKQIDEKYDVICKYSNIINPTVPIK